MDAFNTISTLVAPTAGDVAGTNGSGAPTMGQRGNPGVVAAMDPSAGAPDVNTDMGVGGGNPVIAWVAVLVFLLVLKFAAEHGAENNEFASIKVGFWSIMVITIVSILGINAAKWIFSTWHVPGASALVLAA